MVNLLLCYYLNCKKSNSGDPEFGIMVYSVYTNNINIRITSHYYLTKHIAIYTAILLSLKLIMSTKTHCHFKTKPYMYIYLSSYTRMYKGFRPLTSTTCLLLARRTSAACFAFHATTHAARNRKKHEKNTEKNTNRSMCS